MWVTRQVGLSPANKWFKQIWWMIHGGALVEFFGQMHQAHPKLAGQLVCLEDSSPWDVARGHQIRVRQLSAILSIKIGNMRIGTHCKMVHEVVSKLPYVQAKGAIEKRITSKLVRSLTSVLVCWDRKGVAEPVFRGSIGSEFNGSFKIYHIDSRTHPAAAFHGSWKKIYHKVAQKKVLRRF